MREGYLAVDKGNTKTRFSVVDAVSPVILESTHFIEEVSRLLERWSIKAIGVSNVGASFTGNSWQLPYLEVSHTIKLPFENAYLSPETLGSDRICDLAGGVALFPSEPLLIIDAGTCITFDYLDSKGIYNGGAISPGLSMRLRAMHTFTQKLPELKLQKEAKIIGSTTSAGMQSGSLFGAIGECEFRIEKWLEKEPSSRIIITGGDSETLAKHLKYKIFAEPNLVSLGIWKCLKHNGF